jgi:hypothetical protein
MGVAVPPKLLATTVTWRVFHANGPFAVFFVSKMYMVAALGLAPPTMYTAAWVAVVLVVLVDEIVASCQNATCMVPVGQAGWAQPRDTPQGRGQPPREAGPVRAGGRCTDTQRLTMHAGASADA